MKQSQTLLAMAGLAAVLTLSLPPAGRAQGGYAPGTIVIPGNGGGMQRVPQQNQQYQQYQGRGRGRRNRNGNTGNGQNGYNANGQNGTAGPGGRTSTTPPPNLIPGGVASTAPVSGNGLVYLSSWNNKVYALDPQTGQAKWTFTAGKLLNASPTVGPDGTVYVGAYDHKVYALDGKSGAKKWEFSTGDVLNNSPAVSKGLVYVGAKDHTLYALDPASGTAKWTLKTGAAVASPVVGDDGTVYTGADGIYAVDGQTGKAKWALNSGYDPEAPVAIGPDGTLYVGSQNGLLTALSSTTARVLWTATLGGAINYPPVVANGVVYVGADRVYALHASDGRPIWQYGDSSAVWSTPIIGPNGKVYAGSSDGIVCALNGTDGSPDWLFKTEDSLVSFPTLAPGGILIVPSEGNNKVYALSSRTGKTQWQFSQDPPPPTPLTTTTSGRTRRRGG